MYDKSSFPSPGSPSHSALLSCSSLNCPGWCSHPPLFLSRPSGPFFHTAQVSVGVVQAISPSFQKVPVWLSLPLFRLCLTHEMPSLPFSCSNPSHPLVTSQGLLRPHQPLPSTEPAPGSWPELLLPWSGQRLWAPSLTSASHSSLWEFHTHSSQSPDKRT